MDEAPAKGVDITFCYNGEYPVKTYKAGAKISEGRAVYVDKDGIAMPALSAKEKEHEQELARSQAMGLGSISGEKHTAEEIIEMLDRHNSMYLSKEQRDWPIGDHFEFGKPDTSMMYRFLEGDENEIRSN
jgi:hypothetical protein